MSLLKYYALPRCPGSSFIVNLFHHDYHQMRLLSTSSSVSESPKVRYLKPSDRFSSLSSSNSEGIAGSSSMSNYFNVPIANTKSIEWGELPPPPTTPFAYLPRIYVKFTKNNVHVCITKPKEKAKIMAKFTMGVLGFRTSNKLSHNALYSLITALSTKVDEMAKQGLIPENKVRMEVCGFNSLRSMFFSQLRKHADKILVMELADVTGIPFNGFRSRKPRRI